MNQEEADIIFAKVESLANKIADLMNDEGNLVVNYTAISLIKETISKPLKKKHREFLDEFARENNESVLIQIDRKRL
jgi:hypothetical protein